MSDRERWIVYPVLFFSVMVGLKNRGALGPVEFSSPVQFESIACRKLDILAPDETTKVSLGGGNRGGYVNVYGSQQENGGGGQLNVYGAAGSRILAVQTRDRGKSGQILLNGSKGAGLTFNAADSGSHLRIKTGNLDPQILVGYSSLNGTHGISGEQYAKQCVKKADGFGIHFLEPVRDDDKSENGPINSATESDPTPTNNDVTLEQQDTDQTVPENE